MIAVRQEALGLAKDGTTLLGPALPHLLARHGKGTPGGRGGGGCNGHHKLFAAGADKATVAKRHTGKRTASGKENAGSAAPRTRTHARQRRRRRRRRRGKPPNWLATPRGHRQQVPAALRPIGWGSPPRPRTCAGQQPEGPRPGPPLVHQGPRLGPQGPGPGLGPGPPALGPGPRAPSPRVRRASGPVGRASGPARRASGPAASRISKAVPAAPLLSHSLPWLLLPPLPPSLRSPSPSWRHAPPPPLTGSAGRAWVDGWMGGWGGFAGGGDGRG